MVEYVEGGNCTRESDSRSSIWISVAWRSWASRIELSFSGWEDREGGERRRTRGRIVLLLAGKESADVSMMVEGAIVAEAKIKSVVPDGRVQN